MKFYSFIFYNFNRLISSIRKSDLNAKIDRTSLGVTLQDVVSP